ncbi:MAG: sugar ABC transporter substrate-binding protein [Anaerolineaceae bacterium]|nr:MAG: sugar ABC transporter substrate-binding protein [Anaerolineaceae bacterium]
MKKIVSLILLVTMLFTLTACKSNDKVNEPSNNETNGTTDVSNDEKNEDKIKIGLSIAGLTMPYYVRMYDGFMEAAEEFGYEVTFADGGADAESTVKAVEDLINSDIDALAVSTNYSEALIDSFARCKELNIPIFYIGNLNLIPEAKQYMTFWEGTRSDSAGYLGGLWVGQYLQDIGYKTDLNIVEVSLIHETLHQRYTGFEEGLKEKGFTVNLINTVGDLTRENSLAGSEDMLTAHDNIDIFYGTAGTSALGAFDATQNAGRNEVMVVGFDGEDEELQHIDEDTNYIASICQDPAGESRVTVEAIKTVLEGGTVEGGHETPAKVYGKGVGYVTSDELLGN